jgi:hypothetical protein
LVPNIKKITKKLYLANIIMRRNKEKEKEKKK